LNKFNKENVYFSLNAGKDNTVALYLLAAACYKKYLEDKSAQKIKEDAVFDKMVIFPNIFLK
jgi:hypothetical protein